MRTSPLVGSKPWFGPRRFGWGLDPISAEGWVVTVSLVLVGLLARRQPRRRIVARSASMALVLIAVLKGTSPGGPKARREFQAARAT